MTFVGKESNPTLNQPQTGTIEAGSKDSAPHSGRDILVQPDFRNILRRKHRRSRRHRIRDLLRPDILKPTLRGTINPVGARRIA